MDLTLKMSGQVMLSGEYAVLHGGTAIMMPVPRFLKISEIDMVPDKPYSPVIKLALRHFIPEIADYEKKYGRSHVVVDSSDFFTINSAGFPLKLGLGLSAAEAVGIIAFRFEKAGRPWQDNKKAVFKHALDIHQHAQQFLGTGAGVACCAYGRPLRYRLKKNKPLYKTIERENILYSIPLVLVWTGQQSNTRELIGQFSAWANQDDEKTRKLLTELIMASDKLAESWFVSPNVELFKIIDEYTSILDECTQKAKLSYRLPVHVEQENWARKCGGRAKPIGSGGGDMILLMGDLPIEQIEHLVIPLNTSRMFAVKLNQ
jgi:mevalonate kinase